MTLLRRVRIRAYRSAADVELELGRIAALVGEARAGKSNLLRAVRALLDPTARVDPGDVRRNEDGALTVEAELDDGRKVSLRARPPESSAEREGAPPVVFLPAGLRGETLVEASPGAERAARAFEAAAKEHVGSGSEAAGAGALVAAFEACCEVDVAGVVFRSRSPSSSCARKRSATSTACCTRSPTGEPGALLDALAGLPNVARLEELILVGHDATRHDVVRPQPARRPTRRSAP